MLIDSHTLLFLEGSVLRIDELEINTALKLISYDRREEEEMSRRAKIAVFSPLAMWNRLDALEMHGRRMLY